MEGLSSENAHLIGLLADTLATGVYIAYLPQSVLVLRRKWRAGASLWLPLSCAIIFVLAMADSWTQLVLGYTAFSVPPGESFANPHAVIIDIGSHVNLAKGVFTAALAMFSDLIIVHRTLVVCDYNLIVAFFTVGLLLASYALSAWSVWTEFQTGTVSVGILAAEVSIRVKYFFILTFALNILCAALISWKIRCVTRKTSRHTHGASPLSSVISLVIETAAIYCANLLALIVTDLIQSNAFFIFLQVLPAVNALTYTMLMVRTSAAARSDPSTTVMSTHIRFATVNDSRYSPSVSRAESGTFDPDRLSMPASTAHRDDEPVKVGEAV
ncbi:uncharacterized protein BXZ73DRAFT_95872 [Epithele typhae]|uniref:uncharacterized protein n=1 Tax=Epithele typhae TaxID=378194 RepID=UPI0020074062|nr:uncharacterized protein BXZ73DRAFT_95872 [Epithele typhae]KAH9946374.1 hypothetical protein BXZ73DRAFT_95872 [Epithele typhae]